MPRIEGDVLPASFEGCAEEIKLLDAVQCGERHEEPLP
jgi:hypothetical protein